MINKNSLDLKKNLNIKTEPSLNSIEKIVRDPSIKKMKNEEIKEKKTEKESKNHERLGQLKKRVRTVEALSLKKMNQLKKKTPRIPISAQICGYLMNENGLITEKFEEKFIENLKNGRFLLTLEEDEALFDSVKFKEELKRFSVFMQQNKKAAEKIKQDLKTGIYEEAFKNQAGKIGLLLKRAARNIYNQKVERLDEITEKKNSNLKKRVIDISESMKRQLNNISQSNSKSKFSHVSSRYNLSSLSGTNNSTKKIETFESNSKEISNFIKKTNGNDTNHHKSISFQTSNNNNLQGLNVSSAPHKSILKNRLLSPIFLTDEKSMNLSKIEKNEENSVLMSPGLRGHLKLLRRQKSSLYESVNEEFEKKLETSEKRKSEIKFRNKKENKELRQKLEKILNEIDDSKFIENEKKQEMRKEMLEINENWDDIIEKTTGVDSLRILARDYKSSERNPNMLGSALLRRKTMKFLS